jgi:hypothetical protein
MSERRQRKEEGTMPWREKTASERACCENPLPLGSTTVREACSAETRSLPFAEADATLCPASGTKGHKVDLVTVKALLKATPEKLVEAINSTTHRGQQRFKATLPKKENDK